MDYQDDEIFTKITAFPNYAISNYGRVYNIKLKRFLKPCPDPNGYLRITLTDKKPYTRRIHSLVANAFIKNPEKKPYIDHIDRNKINNNYKNLRWVTCAENKSNSSKSKHFKSSKYIGVSREKNVKKWRCSISVNKTYKHIGYYNTEIEAAKARNKYLLDNNLSEFYPLNII